MNATITIRPVSKDDTTNAARISASAFTHDFPMYKPETITQYQHIFTPTYFEKFFQKNSSVLIGLYDRDTLVGVNCS